VTKKLSFVYGAIGSVMKTSMLKADLLQRFLILIFGKCTNSLC